MGLNEYKKEAPVDFEFCDRACCGCYKYCLEGKGCTLGVLFEDSVNVYFEWLTEDGRPVPYRPEIRYKRWPKREVARLMSKGVYEPAPVPSLEALQDASVEDAGASPASSPSSTASFAVTSRLLGSGDLSLN